MPKDRPSDSHGQWVLWAGPNGYRSQLYLPPALASDLKAEQDARDKTAMDAAAAAMVEEQRRRSRPDISAEDSSSQEQCILGPHQAHRFEVQRYRVLPDVPELLDRIERLKAGMYGQKDSTGRELEVLKAAMARGTHRSVVRPQLWRPALECLGAAMPAFKPAIQVFVRSFELSTASESPIAVPPVLLVGPPGVGKSHFCRQLADVLMCGLGWIAMDQPSAGCELRGTDVHWSTARHGVLFELLGLGGTANPLIVLDEIDKAPRRLGAADIDVLAQLHSALEPETSRQICDVSLGVNLDASLVTYIATANETKTLGAPLLSRFEVIHVGLPSPDERRDSAARIVHATLERLGVKDRLRVRAGSFVVLADYSARVIRRAVERAAANAVLRGQETLDANAFEVALGLQVPLTPSERLH